MRSQVLSAGPSFTGLVEIQPWTSTVMQHQAPQLRLLLHALENVPGETTQAWSDRCQISSMCQLSLRQSCQGLLLYSVRAVSALQSGMRRHKCVWETLKKEAAIHKSFVLVLRLDSLTAALLSYQVLCSTPDKPTALLPQQTLTKMSCFTAS